MKSFYLYFILLCCWLGISTPVNASHLAGADINYTCLGSNVYRIQVKLYRDCSGISAPTSLSMRLAAPSCGIASTTFSLANVSTREVSGLCSSVLTTCANGTLPGYQEVIYEGNIILTAPCANWIISYSDCCRNASITNIANSSGFDFYISASINNLNGQCNNSPTFPVPPVFFACTNGLYNVSHSTSEVDGDSLVYTLTNPLDASGAPIPYNLGQAAQTTSGIAFDATTGQLSFVPSAVQVDVMDVLVEEYRDGVLVGSVRRAMQIIVQNCPDNNPVTIDEIFLLDDVSGRYLSQGLNSTFPICVGQPLSFKVLVSDTDLNQVLAYDALHSSLAEAFPTGLSVNSEYLSANQLEFTVSVANASVTNFVLAFGDNACAIPSTQSKQFKIVKGECAQLRGTVAKDVNTNCLVDSADISLPYFVVAATKGNFTAYTTTDASGNYSFLIDTGDYSIEIYPPNTTLWQPCVSSISVSLPTVLSTAVADFSVSVTANCPFLFVDASTSLLRPCLPFVYNVWYANLGTDTAFNPYIELVLDTNVLIIDSASVAYTQSSDTFTFLVNPIAPFTTGGFMVYGHVDCDSAVVGQTECVSAHIYPDTNCLANPLWNGVDINTSGDCDGDSVKFRIENRGDPMGSPLNYLVVEDDIIFMTGSFQLGNNQYHMLTFPATGATYRVEAEQPPFHPWATRSASWVEGCTDEPSNTFNIGWVTIFDDDDNEPFFSVDCHPIVNSFDPNDKTGFPLGYSNAHYINVGQELEYQIRFQNTGTAPAITVAIVDTISPYLNPTSILPTASSHPYTWSLSGQGVLKIIFNNIMLPDSSSNELASHGYINFSVKQQPNLPLGTVIENTAGIYFDMNAPVYTNTTFHTIGEDFVQIELATEHIFMSNTSVRVFPNPFHESTTLEVSGIQPTSLTLRIYDMLGTEIQTIQTQGQNTLQIERNQLPQGLYIYKLESDNQLLSTGKLIAK